MPAVGDDPQEAVQRLEALIAAIDSHPDAAARETSRELVALVLDLHGLGLAKLMGIVTSAEDGASILARLVEDEQVRALLLLHGLHPDGLETRVQRVVDRLRPHVGVLDLRLDIVEIANGTVRLRLHRGDSVAIMGPKLWALPAEIEDAIVEAAPDVERVVIDGLDFQEADGAIRAAAASA